MPQLGFLVVCSDIDDIMSKFGDYPEFEFQFKNEDSIYLKNHRCRELDEKFGDIQGIISDFEASIVREISKKVLEYSSFIRKSFEAVYTLDW